MTANPQVRLRFWGVRGSIPVPGYQFLGHGGNTTCIEVRIGDSIFVIDAGTGIRSLGLELQRQFEGSKLSLDLLLTHFHWDHIQGLPFFGPIYSPDCELRFHAARPEKKTEALLIGEMTHPYFPVPFELLPAHRLFNDVTDKILELPNVTIRPFPLNHPQGATGYRIEAGGKVITHPSDLEHGSDKFDGILREYARGSDVLIYDAQFTPQEYPSHKGWGHSTWLEATRVAQECDVKRLILFHHDPGHDDSTMINIVSEAAQHFPGIKAAQEGMEIIL
jgi:phosphoribosyl 1,2-cyclic phosphodiesterase